MTEMTTIEGDFAKPDGRLALLCARFNRFIVDSLKTSRLAASGRYVGILALGTIIRGGTPHFEYVAGECTKGLASVSTQYGLPVGFGVLTVNTVEQAVERAGTKAGNKGAEAAMSLLEMISLIERLDA